MNNIPHLGNIIGSVLSADVFVSKIIIRIQVYVSNEGVSLDTVKQEAIPPCSSVDVSVQCSGHARVRINLQHTSR